MNVDDDGVTDSCLDYDRNGEETCSTEMAGVLLSLQSSLQQLVQASKVQTEAFNNLREDIRLQPDPSEEDKDAVTDGISHLLDLTTATVPLSKRPKDQLRRKNRIYFNNSIRSKKQRNHVGTRPTSVQNKQEINVNRTKNNYNSLLDCLRN